MVTESRICLDCGMHTFPGQGHYCKKCGDEEFLKPIQERYRRLQNAEIAIKNVIESNLNLVLHRLDKNLIAALTWHIYDDFSKEELSCALLEISKKKTN